MEAQESEGKHPKAGDVRRRLRRPTKRGEVRRPRPSLSWLPYSHTSLGREGQNWVKADHTQEQGQPHPTAALGRGARPGPLNEVPFQRTERGGSSQGTQKAAPA